MNMRLKRKILGLAILKLVIVGLYLSCSALTSDHHVAETEKLEVMRPVFDMAPITDNSFFHVVITFRFITEKEDRLAPVRMKEYMETLRSNLNNEHVKQLHLITACSLLPGFIKEQIGSHPKLIIHKKNNSDIVLTIHQFVFTYLQGQLVVITQADIVLGEGFHQINGPLIAEKKVMYALSRHIGNNCPYDVDRCKIYTGSHDTFVFVPQGEMSSEGTKLLKHHVYRLGTERVVMHVYSELFQYTLLNPCWIFKVYHHHCSNLRRYGFKESRLDDVYRYMAHPTNRTI